MVSNLPTIDSVPHPAQTVTDPGSQLGTQCGSLPLEARTQPHEPPPASSRGACGRRLAQKQSWAWAQDTVWDVCIPRGSLLPATVAALLLYLYIFESLFQLLVLYT